MIGIPRFLIGDDLDSTRVFIVHAEQPRFIAEVRHTADDIHLEPHWIDSPDAITVQDLRQVMGDASDFYRRSMKSDDSSRSN